MQQPKSAEASSERYKGWPSQHRNNRPGASPLRVRYCIMAWTAQRGVRPTPIWRKQPVRNGSVLEALILTRMQMGTALTSTAKSSTWRWWEAWKLSREGTVNSDERKKPKYARVQAAQNMHWSGKTKSKDRKMISSMWSVTGRPWAMVEPCWRLMPHTTRCKRRQFWRGSGKPSSMCRDRMAGRYTLMEEYRREGARDVAKRHKVHSSAGQGEPLAWIQPDWMQNWWNLFCAEAQDRRVVGANPSDRKDKQRCFSRDRWGPPGAPGG